MKREIRVAILHYHLRGGGVTRIIEQTIQALRKYDDLRCCVFTGEEPGADFSAPKESFSIVEGLSYGKKNSERSADEMLLEIQKKAEENLGGKPDIWHIHNHSLGKNAAFTQLSLLLAQREEKILFHIHDFAEDNRPDNYEYLTKFTVSDTDENLVNQLYPYAPNIHYAVLNGRDYRFLKEVQIPEKNLHLLSNPVNLDFTEKKKRREKQEAIPGDTLFLYPSRGIPRKNIGEFLLWSVLAKEGEHFAVTLPPKNVKYKKSYQAWKQFAEENKLPVTFEAGESWGLSYPQLLQRADAFVSTSIAEGFGMIFLESWLAEKPLLGRNLKEITADFSNNDIRFPGMYNELKIPVKWLGKEKLSQRFSRIVKSSWEKYGITPENTELEKWLNHLFKEGFIDFGKLDAELQREVLKILIANPARRDEMEPSELYINLPKNDIVQENAAIIKNKYNLEAYGKHLLSLYEDIQESSAGKLHYAQSKNLLKHFLSPENFSLITY